jgi:seryl-tRNA synthetase
MENPMLDIKIIREQPDLVRHSIAMRHLNQERVNLDELLSLDASWRKEQGRCDELRNQRNELSTSIKSLTGEARQAAVDRVKEIKKELGELENRLEELKQNRDLRLKRMPNLLAQDAPIGHTDAENVEISRWGEVRALPFKPRDHVELGRITDTIDFDRAAKVTGSNFYYLKREAALLEPALIQYAANRLVPHGFIPIATPDIARDEILEGIGFAPRGPETQVYSLEALDLSLVGTAEITVGGYHSGEILEAAQLPLKYLGFSHCFRTEAGAYGKESRGLYRVHQFTKAEMFILCRPEESEAMHALILAQEEELFRGLAIPYRVVNVCSGDLGAPAVKKYDIEAWMPGRGAYGEVTSCSNCTDYQSRRLNVRFRPEAKASPQFVHLLNGTALAISRALIAVYENYQTEDGSIAIPEVLAPLMSGIRSIPARH